MFTGGQLPDKLLEDKNLTEEEDKDNSNDELNNESDDHQVTQIQILTWIDRY